MTSPARTSPPPPDRAPPPLAPPPGQCATYTFPEAGPPPVPPRSAPARGHLRSASHGGGAGAAPGRSALKGARGHQRALSQGQIADQGPGRPPGHSRTGSKTEFILPPGHKEAVGGAGPSGAGRKEVKGHSRQASRSESIYTLRRSAPPALWRRLLCALVRRHPKPDGEDRQASRSESIYTLRRSAPPALWRRLLCALVRRHPKPDGEDRWRVVVPNHVVPPKTPRKEHPNGCRPDNKIRTTKYTMLSFLPRNLLEQFHRVANLYFIFIVLLNWFPAINAFGKEIAMLPVMFVLGVTAVKDLFEDRRRHASDKRINNSTCRIYNSEAGRYKKVLWKDVKVGDLIHLSNNEVVPADILVLRSNDASGLCYIDTGHLDGETNLKQRQVARGFIDKQHIFEPSKFRSTIEVEAPTTKIYRFHGAIVHPSGCRVPVGTENLLLRECLLKNTDFVEGIVVYAGHETKAMLNNGGPRYKRSSLEKQMNQDVIWCVFMLFFLCVMGAIGCKLWLNTYKDIGQPYRVDFSDDVEAFLAFWIYVIVLQIMIPLSLYVTLELCKIIQVYHIHNNMELYDPTCDRRTECRALNITEELGQIQYVFSDKTGTLTENRMIFRRCAIAGVDYNHPDLENETRGSLTVAVNPKLVSDLNSERGSLLDQISSSSSDHSARIQEFLFLLAACNTVICSHHPHCDIMNASGIVESVPNIFGDTNDNTSSLETHTSSTSSENYFPLEESSGSTTPSPSPRSEDKRIRHIPTLTPINSAENSPTLENAPPVKSQKPKLLNIGFLGRRQGSTSNLTDEQKVKLNRTNAPSPNIDTKPNFEAESPDELALVDAAYSYKCRLLKRTPTEVTVSVPLEGKLVFPILNVLPFDSNRKRMSIIVMHPKTKEIILYCKGADSAILPNLLPVEDDSEQKQIINKTQQHLNVYAREGLRVLVMAKRVLKQQEYNEWYSQYKEAEMSSDNLEKKIQDCYSKIEVQLTLLGATGIEDRLQEGVPETLSALMSAGIVVWVLTGDKPETAINIAYSAKLFSPQMELLKLMTRTREAAENTIHFYLADILRGENMTDFNIESSISSTSRVTYSRSPRVSKTRALVIDGKTLTFILDRRSNLTKPFLNLTTHCSSVLCCRATPLQKAYIVRVVKENLKMRTLAIGDGANDVSMIQTADVGIGISGQEGMQAVMASDFTLSRFKYLENLLLVHGHWSYDRLSRMVLYFFYKNAAFVFLIFWYQFYCGFSGAVMIDQMYLMLYNLLFTSLPPILIGVYDKDAPSELLIENPYLYSQGRLGKVYRSYSFFLTMIDAMYQSIAIYFICLGAYRDSDVDVFEFGTTATTACMFVMLVHASIETRSWTVIHLASIVISIGAFYLYSFVYDTFCHNCFGLPSTYWTIQMAIRRPSYWLVTMLSCVVALLPRVLYRVFQTVLAPDEVTRALVSQRRVSRREPPVTGIRITL